MPVPQREGEGYSFAGWYITANEDDHIYENTVVNNNYDHVLHARWTNIYDAIYLSANEGDVSEDRKFLHMGDIYGSFPTPTRKGYIFLGWFTPIASSARLVTSDDIFLRDIFNESWSTSLVAHWQPVSHTVNLYGNGAVLPVTSIEVAYGGTYDSLPIPSLQNYTFNGWYTKSYGGTLIEPVDTVKTSSQEMLYAQWTGISQTVTFNANGGNVSTTEKIVNYGDYYGSLPTPSLTGYTFDSWYTSVNGNEKVTAKNTVWLTSTQTLYAHWTVKTPTIQVIQLIR